ncbi:Uncharacterised protein [Chromobacterium violaceum]|uniref:Uncharacterized protein n=1 Tax=Chromobacterium violaceum TaxID=536 RepID=A0A447TJV0_CHRVL|nr:Uncharacterised protein [Chromobacterium violaceum]
MVSRHKLDDRLIRDIADAAKYEPGVEVAADPSRRGNAGGPYAASTATAS